MTSVFKLLFTNQYLDEANMTHFKVCGVAHSPDEDRSSFIDPAASKQHAEGLAHHHTLLNRGDALHLVNLINI